MHGVTPLMRAAQAAHDDACHVLLERAAHSSDAARAALLAATDDQGMSVGELNQRASQDLVGTGVKKAVQERNRPQNIRPNSPELAKHPATADTGHQQYNPLAWATNAGGLPVPGEHLRVESGKPDFGNEVFGWATASGGPKGNAALATTGRPLPSAS